MLGRQQVQQRHGDEDSQRQAEGDDRGFRPGFLRGGEGKWLVQSMTLPLRAKSPADASG